jgi:hypothetical protein
MTQKERATGRTKQAVMDEQWPVVVAEPNGDYVQLPLNMREGHVEMPANELIIFSLASLNVRKGTNHFD